MQRGRQSRAASERVSRSPSAAAPGLAAPRLHYRVREGHLLEVDDATSVRMGGVKQKGTRPELVVRRALSALGCRYRLNNRDLDGSPDLANRAQRWVVFVHGCFWHRHGCKASTTPTRNRDFWEAKFARNVERDSRAAAALRALGYTVLVIWECETKRGVDALTAPLSAALRNNTSVDPVASNVAARSRSRRPG